MAKIQKRKEKQRAYWHYRAVSYREKGEKGKYPRDSAWHFVTGSPWESIFPGRGAGRSRKREKYLATDWWIAMYRKTAFYFREMRGPLCPCKGGKGAFPFGGKYFFSRKKVKFPSNEVKISFECIEKRCEIERKTRAFASYRAAVCVGLCVLLYPNGRIFAWIDAGYRTSDSLFGRFSRKALLAKRSYFAHRVRNSPYFMTRWINGYFSFAYIPRMRQRV